MSVITSSSATYEYLTTVLRQFQLWDLVCPKTPWHHYVQDQLQLRCHLGSQSKSYQYHKLCLISKESQEDYKTMKTTMESYSFITCMKRIIKEVATVIWVRLKRLFIKCDCNYSIENRTTLCYFWRTDTALLEKWRNHITCIRENKAWERERKKNIKNKAVRFKIFFAKFY